MGTLWTHVIVFVIGALGGGYGGYKWGAKAQAAALAIKRAV